MLTIGNTLRAHIFDFQHSILRRTASILLIAVPSLGLSYGLQLTVARILDVEAFGVFYAAISLINMLFPPMTLFALFHTRDITKAFAETGPDKAIAIYKGFFYSTLKVGGVVNSILAIALMIGAILVNSKLFYVAALIAVINYFNYIMEAVRSGLMAMQRFLPMTLCNSSYFLTRIVFVVIGLMISKTVGWAMVGMLLAPLPVIYFFSRPFSSRKDIIAEKVHSKLKQAWPFMIGAGAMAIFIHLDIVIAYLVLDKTNLGIYGASSILPKAMAVALMPAVQVLFPMLIAEKNDRKIRKIKALKSLGLTLTGGITGTTFLYIFRDILTSNSIIAIPASSAELMLTLSLSMVAMCCIRVLVYIQLARGFDTHPILLLAPMIVFSLYAIYIQPSPQTLAMTYCICATASLMYYGVLSLLTLRRTK